MKPQRNLTNCCCGYEVDNVAHRRPYFCFRHLLYINACYSCEVLIEM